MRLRRNEYCPIHRSRFCCGREPIRKNRRLMRLCTVQALGQDCVCRMWAVLRPEGPIGTGAQSQPFATICPRSKPASIFSCPA